MRKRSLNTHAVSEVVSTILVISIVISAVSLILMWGVPYIQEKERESQIQKVYSNYDDIDDSIDDLILQGVGTKKSAIVSSFNDMSSLQIKENSDRLIVYYAFNKSYDFNISGLEDNSDNFTVDMINSIKADYANIFPLSMEEKSWFFNVPEYDFPRIYGDSICAQKFKPPDRDKEDWNLSKVDLRISKYGNPTGDIYFSICDNISNEPDINNPLIEESIPSDSISSSMQLIEHTLSNKTKLDYRNEYFIVFNTTGGGKDSEYYKLSLEYKYYSVNETAYNGTKSGDPGNFTTALDEISYQRFICHFIYNENAPPSKAETTGGGFYSGVPCRLTLNSSDSDDDPLKYIVVCDDGSATYDTTYNGSYIAENFYHIYLNSGTYTVKVITEDIYGNVAENISKVFIKLWNDAPDDMLLKDYANIDENNVVNYSKPFKGNFRIDLFNSTKMLFDGLSSATVGYTPFGRIWIFDLDCLSYSATYYSGNHKVMYENGAILIENPGQVSFKKHPSFFEEPYVVALRVINTEISALGNQGGSGKGTYRLGFRNLGSISREPFLNPADIQKVYNFKMQIFGDNSEHWVDYYLDNYDFSKKLSNLDPLYNNTIFYNGQEKYLIFDTSLIEVTMGEITS